MPIIQLELYCTDFPGIRFEAYHPVCLALQKNQDLIEPAPGDSTEATFRITLEVAQRKDGSLLFRGPYAHGKPGEQHLYLVWYADRETGPERFRRAKVMLAPLTWEVIEQNSLIRAYIRLTDAKGGPVCARLREGQIRWEW